MNDKYAPGHFDGDGCTFPDPGHFAEKDAPLLHFWDAPSGGALHAFAKPLTARFTDDLMEVNCDTCRSVMVAAVRANNARMRVTPPTETEDVE